MTVEPKIVDRSRTLTWPGDKLAADRSDTDSGLLPLSWASELTGETIYERQLIAGFYDAKGTGAIFGPPIARPAK